MDDAESFSEMKHEYGEDLLEIVDNLKQEEPEEQTKEALCFSSKDTVSLNHLLIQSEYTNENFVIVSDSMESTNIKIKQEYKEEDPLKIADDFDLNQEVPNKVRYNCEKCDKSYALKGDLKKHIKSVHDNVRYNCDKCDKIFSQKGHLKTHIKSIHDKVRDYNCDRCEKSFSQKGDLNKHIQSVNEHTT